MSTEEAKKVSPLFDSARLELARKARGLQKKELAERVGVSLGAISQYEHAVSKPSPATLAKIALTLGFPTKWFLGGRALPRLDFQQAHFRTLRSTSQRERQQASAHAVFAWELTRAIERRVRLPDLGIEPITISEDTPGESIEDIAAQVRDQWGIAPGPVGHMVRTLESQGVVVTRLMTQTSRVDAFSCDFAERPVVVLSNAKEDKARSRFDAAHELGHLVMHHEAETGSQVVETQAHRFAAAFLMPRDDVIGDLPARVQWGQLLELKQQWGVSMSALLYRARTLGVMTHATHKRAMQYMSSHGWRKDEPGELRGSAEQPSLFAKCLKLLGTRGYTVEDLADDVCLPIDLVVEVAALEDERLSVTLD